MTLLIKKRLYEKKFFEPFVGTGNLVFAYLAVCAEFGFTKEEYVQLINNIFVCDINKEALQIYRRNLEMFVREIFDIELQDSYFENNIGSGLLFDVNSADIQYISLEDVFSKDIIGNGFDIIVTNPPYKNLKAEKGQYKNEKDFTSDKERYERISSLVVPLFKYSTTGILNIYKLFVEEIIERYIAPNGVSSLLIPSSILSDKTCSKLRTYILNNCNVKSIRLIEETSPFVLSSQALCSILFHKGECTKTIKVDGSFNGDIKQGLFRLF